MPPHDLQPGFSVPQLAKHYRVSPTKIYTWIARGELVAVNVAATLAARPQWRISREKLERFEKRRGSTPLPKPRRRRRSAAVDFYPD
jgi:hypothetical protein